MPSDLIFDCVRRSRLTGESLAAAKEALQALRRHGGCANLVPDPSPEAQIAEGMMGSAFFRSASAFSSVRPLMKSVMPTSELLRVRVGAGLNVDELARHMLPSIDADGHRRGGVMGLRYRRVGSSVELYRLGRPGLVRLEKLSFARFDRAAVRAGIGNPQFRWPASHSPTAWTQAEEDNTWFDESGARLVSFVLRRVHVFDELDPIHFQGWLRKDSYRLALAVNELRNLTGIADALAAEGGSVQEMSEHAFDIAFDDRRGRLEVRCEIPSRTLAADSGQGRSVEPRGPQQCSVDSRGLIHVDDSFWTESASTVGHSTDSEIVEELREGLGDEIAAVVARATVGDLNAWSAEARVVDLPAARRMRFALQMWFALASEVTCEEMREYMLRNDSRLRGLTPVAAIAQETDWVMVARVVRSFSFFAS